MEQTNEEAASDVVAGLEDAVRLAMAVEPGIVPALLRTARELARAPASADAWAWLAAKGDPIAKMVVVLRERSGSGVWPTTR